MAYITYSVTKLTTTIAHETLATISTVDVVVFD